MKTFRFLLLFAVLTVSANCLYSADAVSGSRWSRHDWASLRDTITNRLGEVVNVRQDLLYIARRIGPYSADAEAKNQIVRHQITGRRVRPTERNADGSLRWIDPEKFAAFSGKKIVGKSTNEFEVFDTWKAVEAEPGIECAQIVIAEGAWHLSESYAGKTILFTNYVYLPGNLAEVCKPVVEPYEFRLVPVR